jgi:hypothetical protein
MVKAVTVFFVPISARGSYHEYFVFSSENLNNCHLSTLAFALVTVVFFYRSYSISNK